GWVFLGSEGRAPPPADRERLVHPHVGGGIPFARDYVAPEPLRALTADLRQLRDPALLIAVDHEGGRVQRFREGFTAIPPMRTLGERFDQDRDGALAETQRWGRKIADELGGCGIDFSFT